MALVGAKQNITLYQTGDDVEGASFNDLLDALDSNYCGGDDPTQDAIYPDPFGGYQGPKACGTVKPAYVISTSYAYNEADLTPFYTARQCNEYAKLGMLGTTVLYSSGDFGVAGAPGLCLNADGSQTKNGTIFNPSFPGSCPFITSVGATQGKRAFMNTNHYAIIYSCNFHLTVSPGKSIFDDASTCQKVIFSGTSPCPTDSNLRFFFC